IELQPPAVVGGRRLAPELESADFGERHFESNFQRHPPRSLTVTKGCYERYVPMYFVVLCERNDVVHRVAAFVGTQQRKRGGLVGDDREFAIERESRALLCASRYHADGCGRLAKVNAVDRDVVRASTPGADQQARDGRRVAPYAPVERGADRDGGVRRIVDEHRGPCAEPGL